MISPLFHPTTAILVDDNKIFLKTLSLGLHEDIVYQMFHEPTQALKYCLEKSEIITIDQSCLQSDPDSEDGDESSIKVCTKGIKSVLLNPNRFDAVSVIVLDFSMPTLTGAEFIDKLKKNIKSKFVKIIMLTGEAGHGLAVELFNDKKIDKFFLKNEEPLEEKINNAISDMQKAYFSDLCQTTFSAIIEKMAPILSDNSFAEVFAKIIQKLKICEYYLCENTGSFILVNREGVSHILAVRSKGDLEMYAELADDQEVSSELVDRISTGRVIPFFGSYEKFISAKPEDWIINTYPSKKIEGREDYYYSLIEGEKMTALPRTKNITSFAAYMEHNG